MYCLPETHFSFKNTHRLKIEYASGNQKKAGVAILRSNKIDFKPKIECLVFAG